MAALADPPLADPQATAEALALAVWWCGIGDALDDLQATQEAARAAWLWGCPTEGERLDHLAGCLTALIGEKWPERRERPGIAAHLGPWPARAGAARAGGGDAPSTPALPESLPGPGPNTGAGAKYSPVSEPNTGQMGWSL